MGKKRKVKHNSDEDDDDDVFYHRYSSVSAPPQPSTSSSAKKGGSGGLAPSKSTLYVSNLDYNLTNSDLHTLFSTFGKIARVTVLKDRISRQSRGVSFIQYVTRDDAISAASQMHHKILNGRTITATIAEDNGRAPEFIKKRIYKDKSRCYECGDQGHLSYECPKNQLGPRERPVEKQRRGVRTARREEDDGGSDGGEGLDDDNWASVVDNGAEERLLRGGDEAGERKSVKKASYFSDESGDDD